MSPQHVSICPITVGYAEDNLSGLALPFKIGDSLYVDDVSGIVRDTTFDPLVDQFFSKSEAETLKNTRYALTRRFDCKDWDSRQEELKSESLLYRLYLGLKIIRPTTGRYHALHYDLSHATPRLPRGTRNDYGTILCDCDLVNWAVIRGRDIENLAKLAASLLSTLKDAKNPISQAVQSLEIGYRGDFLNVRHLLWVIGLDALFTSTEWESQGTDVAVKRVKDFLGANFKIYPDTSHPNLDGGSTLPNVEMSELLDDVYKLRNDFAHGTWPDKRWAGKVCRPSADFSRDIYYAEVLSEAASAILRGCLKKIFGDAQLVELFSEKAKMNAHFASRGLTRRKRKRA